MHPWKQESLSKNVRAGTINMITFFCCVYRSWPWRGDGWLCLVWWYLYSLISVCQLNWLYGVCHCLLSYLLHLLWQVLNSIVACVYLSACTFICMLHLLHFYWTMSNSISFMLQFLGQICSNFNFKAFSIHMTHLHLHNLHLHIVYTVNPYQALEKIVLQRNFNGLHHITECVSHSVSYVINSSHSAVR